MQAFVCVDACKGHHHGLVLHNLSSLATIRVDRSIIVLIYALVSATLFFIAIGIDGLSIPGRIQQLLPAIQAKQGDWASTPCCRLSHYGGGSLYHRSCLNKLQVGSDFRLCCCSSGIDIGSRRRLLLHQFPQCLSIAYLHNCHGNILRCQFNPHC